MVKNLPVDVGDTDTIPDLGRSHMPRSDQARVPHYWACALETESQQEKPPQWEAHVPQRESSPCSGPLEKSPSSNEDPAQPKINKLYLKKKKKGKEKGEADVRPSTQAISLNRWPPYNAHRSVYFDMGGKTELSYYFMLDNYTVLVQKSMYRCIYMYMYMACTL